MRQGGSWGKGLLLMVCDHWVSSSAQWQFKHWLLLNTFGTGQSRVQDNHLIITSFLRWKDKSIFYSTEYFLQHVIPCPPCRSRPILLVDAPLACAKTGGKCLWWTWHLWVQGHLFFFFISYTAISAGMGNLICKLKLFVGTEKWWVCCALNYFRINK